MTFLLKDSHVFGCRTQAMRSAWLYPNQKPKGHELRALRMFAKVERVVGVTNGSIIVINSVKIQLPQSPLPLKRPRAQLPRQLTGHRSLLPRKSHLPFLLIYKIFNLRSFFRFSSASLSPQKSHLLSAEKFTYSKYLRSYHLNTELEEKKARERG